MALKLVRPPLSDDKWDELERYLLDHYERAHDSRVEQVDTKFDAWHKNYQGIPNEAIRNTPWYKSSNFVVQLIRIFMDTFQARTLNIIYATRPIYVVEGYPRGAKEALEIYIDQKALRDWKHYALTRDIIHRGNKNGTCVVKQGWIENSEWSVSSIDKKNWVENEAITYAGPCAKAIPFEDLCVYPITANSFDEVRVIYHTVRYVEEEVMERIRDGSAVWRATEEEVMTALEEPSDIKRKESQEGAGVYDRYLKELQVVECNLNWAVTNDSSKYYPIIATICPRMSKMIDLYFKPYPPGVPTFHIYKPFPIEDLFYGQSMPDLLAQAQEEASCIHNDRRNNSTLANTVLFKRKSASQIPNPSTNWYPGKVFDLDEMDDLEVFQVGRDLGGMIQEEDYVIQLTERLSGISEVMQGTSQGGAGKRGVYNTGGTLGMLSESNQRQDTNIRDVRDVMSEVIKSSFILQKTFGSNDPTISIYPDKLQEQIRQAFSLSTQDRNRLSYFSVKTSDAGANREVNKANLMQMASVLGQYGQSATQMATQLANPGLNPVLKSVMTDTVVMMRELAQELLRAFNQEDMEDLLPDVAAALEAANPGAGGGATQPTRRGGKGGGVVRRGASETPSPLSVEGLQAIASLPAPGRGTPPQ